MNILIGTLILWAVLVTLWLIWIEQNMKRNNEKLDDLFAMEQQINRTVSITRGIVQDLKNMWKED